MTDSDPFGLHNPRFLKVVACKKPAEVLVDWRALGGKLTNCARCGERIVAAPRSQQYIGDPSWRLCCHDCAAETSTLIAAMGYTVHFPGVRVPEKKKE